MATKTVRLLVVIGMATSVSMSSLGNVSVPGTANIFGAGHAEPPAPGGNGAGTPPPVLNVVGTCLRYVEFTSVTGGVGSSSGGGAIPPDGIISPTTDISSAGGIAGLSVSRGFPLLGVFCTDAEPIDPAPGRLAFGGATAFTRFQPAMRQSFFIGDGLTGTGFGARQRFIVPAGATRLFLGFADGAGFSGPPGFFFDNSGELSVAATVTPCLADFNCSGDAGLQDLFDFLVAYFGNAVAADVNHSSDITVQDVFDFLAAYFSGC